MPPERSTFRRYFFLRAGSGCKFLHCQLNQADASGDKPLRIVWGRQETFMFRRRALIIAVGAFVFGFAATEAVTQQMQATGVVVEATPHVKTEAIIMLQNDALLMRRAGSVEEVGLYLKGVRGVFDQVYAGIDTPETISAVVVVKPGRKARLWLVSSLKNPPDRTDLLTHFQALAAPEVQEGPVAFVIRLTVAGAAMERIPLLPPEWTAAFEGHFAIMPDAITTYLWTD
jgi:hypothetical protein